MARECGGGAIAFSRSGYRPLAPRPDRDRRRLWRGAAAPANGSPPWSLAQRTELRAPPEATRDPSALAVPQPAPRAIPVRLARPPGSRWRSIGPAARPGTRSAGPSAETARRKTPCRRRAAPGRRPGAARLRQGVFRLAVSADGPALRVSGRAAGPIIAIAIRAGGQDGPVLRAALAGERRALTDRGLLRAALAIPFVALKTMAAIHWQALRLLAKGADYRGLRALRRGRKPEPENAIAPPPHSRAIPASRRSARLDAMVEPGETSAPKRLSESPSATGRALLPGTHRIGSLPRGRARSRRRAARLRHQRETNIVSIAAASDFGRLRARKPRRASVRRTAPRPEREPRPPRHGPEGRSGHPFAQALRDAPESASASRACPPPEGQQDKADRDHDRRGSDAHARTAPNSIPKAGAAADHREGQRKPGGEGERASWSSAPPRRRRSARAAGCKGSGSSRALRRTPAAKRGWDPIAAFSTLTTEFSVIPHDIRETSLPPL